MQANDFGGEIIPWAAADGYKVQAYLFNDYWEDIGTIKSFFEANLALAAQVPCCLDAALLDDGCMLACQTLHRALGQLQEGHMPSYAGPLHHSVSV